MARFDDWKFLDPDDIRAANHEASLVSPEENARLWFHIQNANMNYYSPFTMEGYTDYKVIGDGTNRPTPKEICEALDQHPEWYFAHNEGLLARSVTDEEEFKKNKKIVLPSGVYYYANGAGAPSRLVPFEMRTDTGIVLPQFHDKIIAMIKSFLGNKPLYQKLETLYKYALLFYGDPGNGKTTLIRHIVKQIMPKDSIVVFFNEMPPPDFLITLKGEARLKIIIFEEMTNFVGFSGKAQESILSFLDGEMSFDNSIVFGTTNYPDSLPGNLVDRPSRFDSVIKIDDLNEDSRAKLLEYYLKAKPDGADIKATLGLSIAYMKEICMIHHKQGITIPDAIKQMKDYHELVKKEFRETKKIGI